MNLEVVKGCFAYHRDRPILKDLSLHLHQGQILCVLGQNGIGKTTFLRCFTGILKWQSGCSMLDGKPMDTILHLPSVAYVPQAHPVSFPYTVLDMVCMGRSKHMSFFSMPSKLDQRIAMKSLDNVGIGHLAHSRCSQISGGQLQMMYIARALASEPKLLILDEPEAHLDFKNQALVLKKLQELSQKNGIACIINTHHPQHALRISDYTLFLGENGDYAFGETQAVLTEENIHRFFQVHGRIVHLSSLGIEASAFVLADAECPDELSCEEKTIVSPQRNIV